MQTQHNHKPQPKINYDNPVEKIYYTLELMIATFMVVIGFALLIDRHYFFWPPDLQNFENDMRVDAVIIIIGFVFFIYLLTRDGNRMVIKLFLVACGAVVMALAGVQIAHAIGAGQLAMAHNVIGDAFIFAVINYCAWNS